MLNFNNLDKLHPKSLTQNSVQEEIDKYWPKNSALDYYKKMLQGLLERAESIKVKIERLENTNDNL